MNPKVTKESMESESGPNMVHHDDFISQHEEGDHKHHSAHYMKHTAGDHKRHRDHVMAMCGGGMAKGKK